MKYDGIIYSVAQGEKDKEKRFGIISLSEKAYMFTPDFMSAFTDTCNEVAADKDLAAVVIKSTHQKFFSTGADIKHLHSILGKEQANEDYARQVVEMFNAYAKIDTPIMIYSKQKAVGGGVYFFTANKKALSVLGLGAEFHFTNTNNSGLIPIAGAPSMIERIGVDYTKKLLTGTGTLPKGAENSVFLNKNMNLERGLIIQRTSAIQNGLVKGSDEDFDKDPEKVLRFYNDKMAYERKMNEHVCMPVRLMESTTISKMVDEVNATMKKGDKAALDNLIVEMLTENFLSEQGQKGILGFMQRGGRENR